MAIDPVTRNAMRTPLFIAGGRDVDRRSDCVRRVLVRWFERVFRWRVVLGLRSDRCAVDCIGEVARITSVAKGEMTRRAPNMRVHRTRGRLGGGRPT